MTDAELANLTAYVTNYEPDGTDADQRWLNAARALAKENRRREAEMLGPWHALLNLWPQPAAEA